MEIDYFIAGPETEPKSMAGVKTTLIMHNDYSDVFAGIGCFKETFSLQIKESAEYMIRILYKPSLQLYIADWLFRHIHSEGKDEKGTGMNLNINAIETCQTSQKA